MGIGFRAPDVEPVVTRAGEHRVFGASDLRACNSQIATLVERQTRYVMLVKLDGKDSQTVVNALIKSARKLPQELYKSLTWDSGTEMHAHKKFTLATDIQVFFCLAAEMLRADTRTFASALAQFERRGLGVKGFEQGRLRDQHPYFLLITTAPPVPAESEFFPLSRLGPAIVKA